MATRTTKPPAAPKAAPKAAKRNSDGDAQSSFERMLGLLDLFTPGMSVRPAIDLVNYLGTSRSTSYRYIKALHAAGLIEAVANGRYVLGPRIVASDPHVGSAVQKWRQGAAAPGRADRKLSAVVRPL
jgi:DNA-binding IclR family transcriptional regulator